MVQALSSHYIITANDLIRSCIPNVAYSVSAQHGDGGRGPRENRNKQYFSKICDLEKSIYVHLVYNKIQLHHEF